MVSYKTKLLSLISLICTINNDNSFKKISEVK